MCKNTTWGLACPCFNAWGKPIIRKEKERSRIYVVQMETLRSLLGIRKRYRVPNTCASIMGRLKNGGGGGEWKE